MGLITQEQLDEVWDQNGLRTRIGRFRKWLMQRGLYAHVSEALLQEHFHEVLTEYFVKGRRDEQVTNPERPHDQAAGQFTTGED